MYASCPVGLVLTVANLKGGVGKTTTVMHCAAAAARTGHRVIVVDADPQESALSWAAVAEDEGGLPFTVVAGRGRNAGTTAQQLAVDYDVVVMDTPPGEGELSTVRACMTVADLVIIPCSPSGLDVARLIRTVQLAQEIDRPTGILMTRTDSRWKAHKEMLEVLDARDDVALLKTPVRFTVRLGESYGGALGGALYDYEGVWDEIADAALNEE